jgi:hypothetical protein
MFSLCSASIMAIINSVGSYGLLPPTMSLAIWFGLSISSETFERTSEKIPPKELLPPVLGRLGLLGRPGMLGKPAGTEGMLGYDGNEGKFGNIWTGLNINEKAIQLGIHQMF